MFPNFTLKHTKKKKKKLRKRNKEIQSRRISTPSNARSISLDTSKKSQKPQKPKNQKKTKIKMNPNNPWAKFYAGMKVTDDDVKFDISTQKEVKKEVVHDPWNWDALEFKDKKVKIRGNQRFGYGSKKNNRRRK